MKFLFRLFIGIIILIVLLIVFRNPVIKAAVSLAVKNQTGAGLDIGNLDVNLGGTYIKIEDLKLHQPSGFPGEDMVHLPLALVDYNLGDILKGNLHLENINIHLKELVVVRNAQGKLNLDSFKVVQEGKQGEKVSPQQKPGEVAKPLEMRIDVMELQLEKVIYKDYTVGEKPLIQEFNIGIHEKYQNVDNLQSVIGIIVAKALRNSTLARLTNINPETFIQGNVLDTLTLTNQALTDLTGSFEGKIGDTGKDVQDKAKALFGSLKDKL